MFDSKSVYLVDLKKALLFEFDALFKKYKDHKIYAYALVLDELFLAQYSAVSTDESLLTETENKFQYLAEKDKWNVNKWLYRANTSQGVSLFTRKMRAYFQNISLISTQVNASETFNKKALNFYIQCMIEVKNEILERYDLAPNQLIFYIHQASNPQTAITTLEKLNAPSSDLYEAIADLKSLIIVQGKTKFKLNQVDKDILIDLGQILELEPYDDMTVAQHAYLLSLEPYFLETNPFIQRLIHDIASMDTYLLVMSKNDIKNRIRIFQH